MQQTLEGRPLFLTRLAIGLTQGVALYVLYNAVDAKIWPATSGLIFGPLLLFWLYPPLLLGLSVGQMPWPRAAAWATACGVLIAALGFYDIASAWPQNDPLIFPSPELFFFGAAGLLIAHALVTGSQLDHRLRANYSTHFDVAWKMALQLALSGLFVGVFWLLLWLGAGLFGLIQLSFFEKLLGHAWFFIPAVALSTACALHLTDMRPAMVRGARTLLLNLMSWLLPLITLIVTGFIASLPFTGLTSLWRFGHASALLLAAESCLIILINAAYQDGGAEHAPPWFLRLSGRLAACLPAPLVAIAAYALFLRVHQHGWTAERITVAATIIVAASYAAGYVGAAFSRGKWLHRIEAWNFKIAILTLTVLLALFTPIAKPSRLAVASQMARLESGKVAPQDFDFAYLRWEGGRYGHAALLKLSMSKDAQLREAALTNLKQNERFAYGSPVDPGPSRNWLASIAVYPAGHALPQSFVKTDWNRKLLAWRNCGAYNGPACEAFLLDLDGDGKDEVLLYSYRSIDLPIFRQSETGVWNEEGHLHIPPNCEAILDALRKGNYKLASVIHPWRKIQAAGAEVQVSVEDLENSESKCPD
jgi:hypothetical protein